MDKDPKSDFGFNLAKRGMNWSSRFYGKKYVTLPISIWNKGYKSEYLHQIKTEYINPVDQKLSTENVAWFDKAIEHYYTTLMLQILNKVETQPHKIVLKLWEDLLIEMYGDDSFLRLELNKIIMNDDRFSLAAKNWLKKVSNI